MMITAMHYLVLGSILFSIGLLGLLVNRHDLIHLLLCIEVLLLAINTQFVALSHYFSELSGQIIVFFVLATTASETAIALAMIVLLFHAYRNVDLTQLNQLKG